MKFTTLLLMLVPFLAYSQENYEYSNSELFKGKGIVFTEKYKPPIKLPEGAEVFTPDKEDIIAAEKILFQRFNGDVVWTEKKKNVERRYWKYNRQYLGFVDSSGERHILINLLNFKCKKKAAKKFEGWEKTFFIGFGEYYEKNSSRLLANLTTRRLSLF